MRLIDIANNIDKSSDNEDWLDVSEIADIFNINLEYVEQGRLKAFWIGNWYCTDSYVGYKMYFLDNIPVAFSEQLGRKCEEDIEWFSREDAMKVRDYLITLATMNNDDLDIDIIDINTDIGDCYKIDFNSQILSHSKAMLNNEPVSIVERIKDTPDLGIDQMLKIQISDGEEKIVNISELDFKFHTV